MILVHGREWNILCDLITKGEQDEIEKTVVSRTLKPRTIYFDEDLLRPELKAKVKKCLGMREKS